MREPPEPYRDEDSSAGSPSATPAISVALPVYNGAQYLREALDSVLAQELGDFELCVSDNQSTDDTPAILAEYARRDPRVKVSRAGSFLPQAANVNRAVEMCSAEWVKLFCHDDLMHPRCLSQLWAAVQGPAGVGVSLVGNGEEYLFANGYRHAGPGLAPEGDVVRFHGPSFVRDLLTGRTSVGTPALTTAMVRKSAWDRAGRFDARFMHFDAFLWLRLLVDGDYIAVPSRLTVNRIHGAQVFVEARRNMRTVEDQRVFWREYLPAFADRLGLGWRARWRARLTAPLFAGAFVAIALLQRRLAHAAALVGKTPVLWWPVLPVFIVRGYANERRKLAALRPHVPASLIYPG